MQYQKLQFDHIHNPVLRKVLLHSDMMLHDLYQVFKLPTERTAEGGGGNFSIAVVLLCIVDGLSVYLYPTTQIDDQEQRFKKLIRDKMYWGSTKKGWVEEGLAAKQLYLEMRNPLVHELGADKNTSARIAGYFEPRIAKWGTIPQDSRDIDKIQGMVEWNEDWPILAHTKDRNGREYVKFSDAAMFWAGKKMIVDLINDKSVVENAIKHLDGQVHDS